MSDGSHTTTLGPVRVDLADGPRPPVRLNHADGDFVSGTTPITATADGDSPSLALSVDGRQVGDVVPSLEAAPRFAFEATNTDAFFRNGVKIGDEVLTVFDEGFYERTETVPRRTCPSRRWSGARRSRSGSMRGPRRGPSPTPTRTTTTGSPSTPGSRCPTVGSCDR